MRRKRTRQQRIKSLQDHYNRHRDWVLGDPTKENYQDNRHLEFIKNSTIVDILERNGFVMEEIADLHSFHLLDYPAPDLCADRVDYTLREIASEGYLREANEILRGPIVHRDRIIFNNKDSAFIFSSNYARLNREHWAGNEAKARYHILAEILKTALTEKIISVQDIEEKNDYEILKLLEISSNNKIVSGLGFLRGRFRIIKDSGEGAFYLRKKFRYVDPLIFNGKETFRLSEVNKVYGAILEKDRKNSLKEDKIRISGIEV